MKLRGLLLTLVIGGLGIQSAHADSRDRWERQQEKRERLENRLAPQLAPDAPLAGRIGPSEAARMAQMRNGGGRVLDVTPSAGGWRVKLIKAGEVRTVLIPDSP